MKSQFEHMLTTTIEFVSSTVVQAVLRFLSFLLALGFCISVLLVIIAILGNSVKVATAVDGCNAIPSSCGKHFLEILNLAFVEVRYFLNL